VEGVLSLKKCQIINKSVMQKVVALLVTEAELYTSVKCAQDMSFVWKIIKSIGLKVKLPVILELDNKGAVDIANNWSVAGLTKHIDTKQYFIRQLKEDGIIKVRWIPGKIYEADLYTKNLSGPDFRKHTQVFIGEDEYDQIVN